MAVVTVQTRRIDYYDSCGGDGIFWLRGLLDYLSLKWNDQMPDIPFYRERWILNSLSRLVIPQQENGWDCGVFICLFTPLLLQEKELQFTQFEVNEHVREKIALSLLKRKLIE